VNVQQQTVPYDRYLTPRSEVQLQKGKARLSYARLEEMCGSRGIDPSILTLGIRLR
jgi:hypothetical protein